ERDRASDEHPRRDLFIRRPWMRRRIRSGVSRLVDGDRDDGIRGHDRLFGPFAPATSFLPLKGEVLPGVSMEIAATERPPVFCWNVTVADDCCGHGTRSLKCPEASVTAMPA